MIFIPALLITVCVITCTVQNIFTKQYNIKCPKGEYTYSALIVLFALLFFVFTTKDISFAAPIIPYSLAFSAVYTICTFTAIIALKYGSLAITSLIMSYSLIIPTGYGFIYDWVSVRKAPSVVKLIGIGFLLVSLFLIRDKSEEEKEKSKKKVSFIWLINVIIAFVTNGLCSVFQSAQENKFKGTQSGNFMILSLIIGFAALLILAIIFEHKVILESTKKGLVLAAAGGICNGATNLLVMVIVGMVSASFFFPVLSACQIIITAIISVVFFKETFIKRQIVGLIFGVIALVLLNL